MRLSVEDRIEILCDEGSFVEMDKELSPVDPLDFVDKKSYKNGSKRAKKRPEGLARSWRKLHY